MDAIPCLVARLVIWIALTHRYLKRLTLSKKSDNVVLATIVKTWRSSCLMVGAMLGVQHDGQLAVSLSGGRVEDDLI